MQLNDTIFCVKFSSNRNPLRLSRHGTSLFCTRSNTMANNVLMLVFLLLPFVNGECICDFNHSIFYFICSYVVNTN